MFTKRILVAAGLAIVFGPMAVAGLRLAWLNFRLADAAGFEAAMVASERRIALYGQIQKFGWPMSKLLSDIACTTPDGIELESINIDHGSNAQVRGIARGLGEQSSVDAIVQMEERMRGSKVFSRIVKSWEEPKGGSTEFAITAQVDDPMKIVRYPESQDFGKKSLAEQRWGPIDSDGFLIEAGSAPASGSASGSAAAQAGSGVDSTGAEGGSQSARAVASGGAPVGMPSIPDNSPTAPGGSQGAGGSAVATGATQSGAGAAGASEAARVAPGVSTSGATSTDPAPAASGADGAATTAEGGAREGRSGRRGSLPGASAPTEASRRGRPAVGAAQPAEEPIPPALTQDQVDAMSRDEARDMLIKIAAVRQRDGLTEEVSTRLKKDFDMLKARTRKP